MKKSIHSLLALAAFGASALFAQAQPALKILTIDMAKLYDGHYKTACIRIFNASRARFRVFRRTRGIPCSNGFRISAA